MTETQEAQSSAENPQAEQSERGGVRCRGYNRRGERCKNHTTDSSGLCNFHREHPDFLVEGFLRCSDCIVRGCEHRDLGIGGFCYYEINDDVADFDSKEKLIDAMRTLLGSERRILLRLGRILSTFELTQDAETLQTYMALSSLFSRLADTTEHHLVKYGAFLGWEANRSSEALRGDRLKLLREIFKEERESDSSMLKKAKGTLDPSTIVDVPVLDGEQSNE